MSRLGKALRWLGGVVTDALGSGPLRPCMAGHDWRYCGDATEGLWRTCNHCGIAQAQRVQAIDDDMTDTPVIDTKWETVESPTPIARLLDRRTDGRIR